MELEDYFTLREVCFPSSCEKEIGSFLIMHDHLLCKINVIVLFYVLIISHISGDFALNDLLLSVKPTQASRKQDVRVHIKLPLPHIDCLHGPDIVGIWKIVLLYHPLRY